MRRSDVTIDDICGCRRSRRTFFRYFADKEALAFCIASA
jgi:hypothetical protein